MKSNIISALFLSLATAMPAFGVATPSPNITSFAQEQLQAQGNRIKQ